MSNEIRTLIVDGMSCSHCENSVKNAVGALEGVTQVDVDLAGKKVTVAYDPNQTQLDRIKATIDMIGFEVIEKS